MNIILIILDSLNLEVFNSFKEDLKLRNFIIKENHWTNNTWTIPSMSTFLTGKIPTNIDSIYSKSPHRILYKNIIKNKLWNSLRGRYYTLISSPWQIINEMCFEISRIFSLEFLNTNNPFVDSYVEEIKGYYKKRIQDRKHLCLKNIPKPFFSIIHNTNTHSEFNLSANKFLKILKNKSISSLIEAQAKQFYYFFEELDLFLKESPEDTMIIITADHGEDFEKIIENECGHASCYTKSVLNVPLAFYYKGSKQFSFNNNPTDHTDLFNQIVSWINNEGDILNSVNKNYIFFSQGPYIGDSSIKFLEDIKIGVLDIEKDLIYLQSMKDEKEYLFKNNIETNISEDSPINKDVYRKILLNLVPNENKELEWSKIGIERHRDDF